MDNELEILDIEQPTTAIDIAREIMTMEKLMEQAQMWSKSTIVPLQYQNKPENCLVAIDFAVRMGVPTSPLVIMQNLDIIQGKPSFNGKFIASMIRSSRQFKDVELIYVGDKDKDGNFIINDNYGAYVVAIRNSNGKELRGGTVTIGTAKSEGWYTKVGSKWKTMPTQMLAYRAYAWFQRVYAPELTMGLLSSEEVEEIPVAEAIEITNPFGDN